MQHYLKVIVTESCGTSGVRGNSSVWTTGPELVLKVSPQGDRIDEGVLAPFHWLPFAHQWLLSRGHSVQAERTQALCLKSP